MATKITAEELCDAIRAARYHPESYSGRFMFGAHCVSVYLDETSDLVSLGSVPKPQIDSMGKGVVAYWPNITLSEELRRQLDHEEQRRDEAADEGNRP